MFFELNGRILDREVYEREALLLQKVIEYECSEIFRKYGFKKKEAKYELEELGMTTKIIFEEPEFREI